MTKINSGSYWRESRKPVYSLILSLPLIFLYEAGIFLINEDDLPILRNGADVLIRNLLESMGILGIYTTAIILIIGFFLVLFLQRKTILNSTFRKEFLPFMVLESLMWGLFLFVSMGIFRQMFFANPSGKIWFGQIVMSLGAGIYEEIFFRLILVTLIIKILKLIFNWKGIVCQFYSILIAACLFSLFHFMGAYADKPELSLFFIRFFGGCFLGCLFLLRGFGITAYTHCIYDLIVVVNLTV